MSAGNALTNPPPSTQRTATPRLNSLLTVDRVFELLPLIVLGIALVLLALFVPNFYRSRNIINIFVQASTLGLMAIGMTVVLIGGGIDLSIPSIMALSAIVGSMYMEGGGSILISCLLMLIVGCAAGSINGFAVAYLGMIPFVVTLAMMTVATGTSIWITNSVSVPVFNETFFDVILDRIFNLPRPIYILAIMTVLSTVVIRGSVFGRWLYAVGTNIRAARVAGIPTRQVLFLTYVISGFFAGLTAIILSARLGAASANMGNDGVVLDVVSAAVVGGVSIYGGVGGPLRAVLGAILITVISNSMNMMQISFFTSLMIKGVVIIAFVAFDSLRRS